MPLLCLLALTALVAGHQTGPLDSALLKVVGEAPRPSIEGLVALTHAGDTGVILVVAACLATGLALVGRPWTGGLILGAVGVTALANIVLKLVVNRARPDPMQALIGEAGLSPDPPMNRG